MSAEAAANAIAFAAVLLTVLGLYVTTRDGARRRREQDVAERAELQGQAFARGAASRDDEVRQLTFERDDARRERDELRLDNRELLAQLRLQRGGAG